MQRRRAREGREFDAVAIGGFHFDQGLNKSPVRVPLRAFFTKPFLLYEAIYK